MNMHRKIAALTAAMALAGFFTAGAEEAIASIDFIDGPATVTRDGSALPYPGIGDDIYDGDLIATGASGTVTLKLSKETGMTGSIKVAPKSSFYLNIDSVKGEKANQVELIAGQLALKVKKLAGTPTFNVDSGNAACAVRGTEFEVVATAGGSVLVDCSEGEVACSSEGITTSALPGQAVEKREGAKIARRAVKAADYESFRNKWIEDEGAAFKRDAPKAARAIAARYLDLSDALAANHEKLAASGALKAWLAEERGGLRKPLSDAELDRRLAETTPLLKESMRILSAMERLASRVVGLEEALGGDAAVLSQTVRPGRTVGDFFARFEAAQAQDLKRIAVLRKAVKFAKLAAAEREGRKRGKG
jgi:hypothetical protein